MIPFFIKKIFSRNKVKEKEINAAELLRQADELNANNDFRTAQRLYRDYLDINPHHVGALNELACCLAAIGDEKSAIEIFSKARILDDSDLAITVNYAAVLKNQWCTDQSLVLLRNARARSPAMPNIFTVYSSICQARGDAAGTRRHALNGWLGIFDNLRLANSYMFACAYDDIDERLLAAEHSFWSSTLKDPAVSSEKMPGIFDYPPTAKKRKKIRIGYWSPDLRGHSVTMFFRPLLEGHNRDEFEIYVYHDSQLSDLQTDAIKESADKFIDIFTASDQDVCDLFWSHDLDVMVEMAGHTSSNRLNLMAMRFAKIQITGIGYPPTTGLRTIDYKLVDQHITTAESACFYTEKVAVLPNSFWCFDPKEEVSLPSMPPFQKNGYITFGCVGNTAKINSRIIRCWAKILEQLPSSRLILRSLNFSDLAANRAMLSMLEENGISKSRVELKKPAPKLEFFESYDEIDILLDTFPFNGGTTSCFGTYMGVPIVSWYGQSLISRMGKSILSNLGMNDWAVTGADAYIARAIRAATELDKLVSFRAEARSRYKSSSLGDGSKFAQEFEALCVDLLQTAVSLEDHQDSVEALPVEEIIRRAYFVLQYGQFDAARRIVDYGLQKYPNCGAAHVLWTERLTSEGDFSAAISYLLEKMENLSEKEKFLVLVNLTRFCILERRIDDARKHLGDLQNIFALNAKEKIQVLQLDACLNEGDLGERKIEEKSVRRKIKVIVVSDDPLSSEKFTDELMAVAPIPDYLDVEFFNCDENEKLNFYINSIEAIDSDICMFVQKNVTICNPYFWAEILAGLESADIIGVLGALKWSRLDWGLQPYSEKSGSYVVPSGEKDGFFDLNYFGDEFDVIRPDMAVLSGQFIALNSYNIRHVARTLFDTRLEGGAMLVEEYFSHKAFLAGFKLATHNSIGIMIDWKIPVIGREQGDVRVLLSEMMDFEPLIFDDDDRSVVAAPVPSLMEAWRVQCRLAQRSRADVRMKGLTS